MLYNGQTIVVKTHLGKEAYSGTVHHISTTSKVVVIVRRDALYGAEVRFYRDDRQGSDRQTYINDPGAGSVGYIMNDRFVEPEATTKVVKNLMSGEDVEIPSDTPFCCDPSTETYWSM